MPAAAVIPAELRMGNIVAVKTFVVTFELIIYLNDKFKFLTLFRDKNKLIN